MKANLLEIMTEKSLDVLGLDVLDLDALDVIHQL